jgi:hypothetical protein
MIKEEYKLLLKYRWKLFLNLYLKRWIGINGFLLAIACNNFYAEGDVLGFIALCIGMPLFLFLFMFADYHNPDNNPIHNNIKNYGRQNTH